MSRLQQRNAYAHSSTPSPAPVLIPNPSSSSLRSTSPYLHQPGFANNSNLNGNASAGPSSRPGSSLSHVNPKARDDTAYSESPYGGGSSEYSKSAHQLEGQNDERLEGIMGKVRLLKDLSIGISDEVKASNMELGGMNDAFASTSTFLGGTFKRMNKMAKRQGGNWCNLMLFLLVVLFIFFIVWIIRR